MNTAHKGNDFERHVFNVVSRLLSDGDLGIDPNSASVYWKRGYFSRDRATDIVFDVAVEVRLRSADRYSFLWLCECKDYQTLVPVSDVEEFYAKVQQVAPANSKAVIATTGALQTGALQFARSKGIGVLRVLPSEQVQWSLASNEGLTLMPLEHDRQLPSFNQRSNRQRSPDARVHDAIRALTDPSFVSRHSSAYGLLGDLVLHDLEAFIKESFRALVARSTPEA